MAKNYPSSIASDAKTLRRMQVFNVYLDGKLVDVLYFPAGEKVDSIGVKKMLVGHDAYEERIVVRKKR